MYIRDQRRGGLEPFERRRKFVGLGGLRGYRDDLLDLPPIALLIPRPDRTREILQADHDADEAVGLPRVVRRPDLENELLLVAEVARLHELAAARIPEVQIVAVLARK